MEYKINPFKLQSIFHFPFYSSPRKMYIFSVCIQEFLYIYFLMFCIVWNGSQHGNIVKWANLHAQSHFSVDFDQDEKKKKAKTINKRKRWMDLQGNPIASIMFIRYLRNVRLFCVYNQMRSQVGFSLGEADSFPKKINKKYCIVMGCWLCLFKALTAKRNPLEN